MAETQRRSTELCSELVEALVQERIDSGEVDLDVMSFAEIEQLGHGLGRELSQRLQRAFVTDQGGRMPPDFCCPTCGLECEAIRKTRTIKTIDGPTEITELTSYCPQCRRSFFPSA